MTRRAAVLALVVVAALAAVALAAVLAWRGTHDVLPGAEPVAVRRWVEPESQVFGDPVVATIDVVVDRERVDADSVDVAATFAPYEVVGEPERTRTAEGPLVRIRTRYRLQCLTQVCVPEQTELPLTLAPAKISYLGVDGTPGTPRSVPWPPLTISSQFAGGEPPSARLGSTVTSGPLLRARVQPPDEPTWRFPPVLAQIGLIGGAVLLVGLAALLLLPLVRRGEAPAPEPERAIELTPLERALVGLDWARAAGGSREQRKALELLAEELQADTEDDLSLLADDARVLAWSARPPGDDTTATLAQRVREIVDERARARAELAEADGALVGSAPENGRRG